MAIPGPPEFEEGNRERREDESPGEGAFAGCRFVGDRRAENMQGKKGQEGRNGGEIKTEFAHRFPKGRRRRPQQRKKADGQTDTQQLNRESQIYECASQEKLPALPLQQNF